MADTSSAELATIARESVFAVNVAVRFAGARRLYTQALVEVDRVAGTTMRARVDPGGVYLSASPGLHVVGRGLLPDFSVTDIAYDFQRARFDVHSPRGLGGPIVEAVLEGFLNTSIAPRLPAALRRPGYSPQTDPDLAGTIAGLVRTLGLGTSGTASVGGGAALPPELADGVDLAVSLDLQMSGDIRLAVPGMADYQVAVPRGRILTVELRTAGSIVHPVMEKLHITAHDRGVLIEYAKPGLMGLIAHFDVTAMLVRPGPLYTFEVVMLIERLADSLGLVAGLAASLAGAYHVSPPPPARIEAIRPLVNRMLADGISGLVSGLLATHDRIVPGISLRAFLAGQPLIG